MKILHVGWGYPPNWMGCGPVIYVHTLAVAQRNAGDQPLIMVASDQKAEGRPPYDPSVEAVEGIPYIHLKNRPVHMHDMWNPAREMSDPACRRAVEHVLAETNPDVVHIHNLVGLSFDVIDAARESGARVVTSLHNYFTVCSRDDLFFADAAVCGGPQKNSCARCLGTMVPDELYRARHRAAIDALNSSDALLAVSSRVAEIYAAQGVRADLLHVDRIGSATAERLWTGMGADRVAQAQSAGPEGRAPGSPLRFIFFGALSPRKGIMTFVQAARLLKHPESVEMHVLGAPSPEITDQLKHALATFPAEKASRIAFHGGFDQNSLHAALASFDAAVLTPRWEDNGPQTVMEALAAGLPVVGTRIGGIPDVVLDGVNGLLVDEGDVTALARTIDHLVENPGRLNSLRAGIRPPVTIEEHRGALAEFYSPKPVGVGA